MNHFINQKSFEMTNSVKRRFINKPISMKAALLLLLKLIILSIIAVLTKNIILIFYPYTWLTYQDLFEYLGFGFFSLIITLINSLFRLHEGIRRNLTSQLIIGSIFGFLIYYLISIFFNPYFLSFKLHSKIIIFCLPLIITGLAEPLLSNYFKRKFK
jgi:hypothetical protein